MKKPERRVLRRLRNLLNRQGRERNKQERQARSVALTVIEPEIIYARPVPRQEPENPQVAMMKLMAKVLGRLVMLD